MKKAIVVGSGAGGATVAKELQGHDEVTVLEAGQAFKPFGMKLEGAVHRPLRSQNTGRPGRPGLARHR